MDKKVNNVKNLKKIRKEINTKEKKNETHRHTQCQTGIYARSSFLSCFFLSGIFIHTKKNKQIKFDKLWKGYWPLLVVMALADGDAPTGADDLLSIPDIAKLLLLLLALPLLDSASIPARQPDSADVGDDCPGIAVDPPVGMGLPLGWRLLPGGLVIMAVTEAGMDNPVVWFM